MAVENTGIVQYGDRSESSVTIVEQRWLTMQCRMLEGIISGLLFKVSPDGSAATIEAFWPRRIAAANDILHKVLICARRDTGYREELPADDQQDQRLRLFKPIAAGGERFVLVLEMDDRSPAERRTVANVLRWNSEWLKFALVTVPQSGSRDLAAMFSLAIVTLEQSGFRATATALVTELAARYLFKRVTLGLRHGNRTRVEVLSHSARVKHESNLMQEIAAAMDEAVDQDRALGYPAAEGDPGITQAHRTLSRREGGGFAYTLPLSDGDRIVGALTLEREASAPMEPAEREQIEQILAVVVPALWLRREQEKALPLKILDSAGSFLRRLFGPTHIGLKLSALSALALLVFFSVAKGDWRVTADAVIEGSVQRTIAAPIDGYIAAAEARPGDVVNSGDLIGALDDSDLRLERLKWSTLRQQMVSELREARAQNDRAEVSIITAKIDQADAELQLVDEQLARTRLRAPFDGIIIEGDLSQRLGTPVKRGDPLFLLAPLEDYRIVLQVDEQDIAPVSPGLRGRLILASLPNQPVDLEVTRVTPVSSPGEGRNYFRVEARLLGGDLRLQPGMEGVGKINVGEARLIWIWTRELRNWLRLKTWTWWR